MLKLALEPTCEGEAPVSRSDKRIDRFESQRHIVHGNSGRSGNTLSISVALIDADAIH
jgi:hypothetical protein